MDKEYKGLEENIERFKNDLTDEKMRLLFSIAYKQGYDQALSIANVVGQSEQLLAVAEYVYNHFDDSSSKTAEDYLQDFLSQ